MDLNVSQWPLGKLVEYDGNPRINDQAVDRVAAAIKEFGFRVPILARSDGRIVDGHLRLKAARKLDLATVPVLLADDMNEAQVKAFRLSVNKVADLAEWDEKLLAIELSELREMQFDMSTIGFTDAELKSILDPEPLDSSPQLGEGFKYSVIVAARNEAEQVQLLELFETQGYECRPFITQER